MTLANLTRRNKDYRSKTRRKTKLQQQQQQQMREEKQSIGFERCLQVQKLDAKLFAREREKSGTHLRSAGAVVATNVTQKLPPASSSQTWQGERKETTIAMRYCSCIKLRGGHEATAANSQIPILGGQEIDQQLGKVTN
jgi:hypothetical protein